MTKKLLVRVNHEELDLPKLIEHLEQDLVYVFFRKVTNGQFRSIYPFTLNPKHIPLSEHKRLYLLATEQYIQETQGVYFNPKPGVSVRKNMGPLVKAYSLVDKGWRSFYTQNLMFYEVCDQEGDTL